MRPQFAVALFLACTACLGAPPDVVPPPLSPKELSGPRDDPGPGVDVEYRKGQITRRDAFGRLLWTAQLGENLIRHRDPHILHDADRIYLSQNDGVTALDLKTGKVVWHTKGPSDRLYLSGKLLLATECSSSDEHSREGRWFTARDVANGAERFNIGLPVKDFDPLPIREVAGLFLVQASDGIGTKGSAFLVDRQGKVRHRFKHLVLDGKQLGEDRVFLTIQNIVRMNAGDKELWAIPFDSRGVPEAGQLLDVAGGHLLVFRFGQINDSGVQVIRFDPKAGKKVWETKCAPLGVGHSKYHHRATVIIEGQQVRVTSRGSSGSFVETLDLESGKQLKRERNK